MEKDTKGDRLNKLEKTVDKDPKNDRKHLRLACEYENQNMLEKAAEEYKKVKQAPEYYWACNNLGNIYQSQGLTDKAVKTYRIMLKGTKSDKDLGLFQISRVHTNRGNTQKEKGELKKAIREYKKALKIYPKDIYVHQDLAEIYLKQGRLKDAEKEYKTILNNKKLKTYIHHRSLAAKAKKGLETIKRTT